MDDSLAVARARREAARLVWREVQDLADRAKADFHRLDVEVERLLDARDREAEQGG